MKKVIVAALLAVVFGSFGLVGCSSSDKVDGTGFKNTRPSVETCRGKKCKKAHKVVKDKLGEEKLEEDINK
jgi:uncharacterized lipoprotein NlpE involved in copper resistance